MSEAPPPPDKQRFASASGPVNRRTASPSTPAKPVVHQAVRQRLARNQVQQVLGSPLTQQLAAPPGPTEKGKSAIAVGVGASLSVATALVAGLLASWPWAAASALCGASVGAYALLQQRKKPAVSVAPAFDPQALSALDTVLTEIAPKVSADTLAHLVALKATLVRMAPLMNDATASERFTQDDRFYVGELVRRYLPDTLGAYLRVPTGQREVAGADGSGSARDLLNDQLTLLQDELKRRELLLVQDSHAALQQQQRFLQAKHQR